MRPARPSILALLALCAVACGEREPGAAKVETAKAPEAAAGAAAAGAGLPSAGSIEGEILFEGAPPPRAPINTAAEGGCGLDPDQPALTEAWVVDSGRMANVFVWIANPPAEPADATSDREPVVLRQRGCVYRPHALGLRTAQKLLVTNEDRARHNVRSMPRKDLNPSINLTQVEGAAALEVVFAEPEVAIPIVCDLHPWMKAWVGVFDHRFFAVTGADGRFGWSGLPPGEYEVRAWHEVLGRLSGRALLTPEVGARVTITFRKKD